MRKTSAVVCGILSVLLFSLSSTIATADSSVRGHGTIQVDGATAAQLSINAWVDADGAAHGAMVFTGGFPIGSLPKTGPANPWLCQVTYIEFFDGNSAFVYGTVVFSVFPEDIGIEFGLIFTDNGGTGLPDEITFSPITNGNIVVAP